MGRMKKIIGCIIICAILLTSVTVVSYAAYQEYNSSLSFRTALIGESRKYNYPDVGFKFKNATCTDADGDPIPTAYFLTELRMSTGFLGAWEDKGEVRCTLNGVRNTYYGWTYEDAHESGKTHRGYYGFGAEPYYTQNQLIECPTFIMFSQS